MVQEFVIPSRVTRVRVNTRIPWMLGRSVLSHQAKEKGNQVRAISAVGHIFNETAMHARAPASNRLATAITASHGPRVSPQSQAKERVKRTMDCPKEPRVRPKDAKVPKAQAKAKPRKLVSQVLKT